MECEKCRSKNLIIKEVTYTLRMDFYTDEHYTETIIHFECHNCGCEFTELV